MIGAKARVKSRIRPATRLDASLLAALHKACFDSAGLETWDESAMAQFIAGPSTVTLLATTSTDDAHPIGFLIARKAADEAELLTIGVLADYRDIGIGDSLLRQAMLDLKAAGARALYLEVDETNHPARALYRRHGASVVGSRSGYYENGSNAAILRVDLQSCPLGPPT
jgi:ribosomal-protein-alanine N-acetyltransferase